MDETEVNITLRDYQLKLVHHCVDKDAIAVLPTGSGKTLIAIKVMENLVEKTKKKAAFIVNKVVNIDQQYEYIKKHLKLKVEKWSRNVTKNSSDFIKMIDENDVIVLIAETFKKGLTHGWIKLENYSLIVIDECHHAIGDKHPSRFIVERIKEHKKANKQGFPRFLGLSASGLNGKIVLHQLPQKFMQLEIILGGEVVTSDDYLLDGHRHAVKETVFFTESYKDKITFDGLETLEKFCLLNTEFATDAESDPRKIICACISRARTVICDCGIYCGYIVIEHDIIPHIKKMMDDLTNSSAKFGILSTALTEFIHIQMKMEQILKTCNTFQEIVPYLHPRVTKIIELLEAYENYQNKNGKKCVAIIFAEKCDTVMALALLLRKLVELRPSFIKVAYAVGAGTQKLKFGENESNSINGNLTETLKEFRSGKLNCLVSTQVLEEGIDIPSCNLVICTHISPTFCSYIQSRGRARDESAMLAYIIPHNYRSKYIYNAHVFKSNEKFLLHRISNFKNSIPNHHQTFYDIHIDTLEEPHTIESTSASVKLSTALGLVHLYCSRLPSDVYTHLSPKYHITRASTGYRCEIELPSNSPLQEKIIGEIHATMELAYFSACLATCKKLHENKELDDNLLPYSKEKFAEKENFTFEFDSGTTKKHRLYDKKVADTLVDNYISADTPFWIYIIEMEVVHRVSDVENPKRRKIMDFKNETPHIFGFCSKNFLPQIPTFPIFHKYGKLITSLKLVENPFTVSQNQLDKLQKFHTYAFDEILGISSKFVFDPMLAIFSTLIIPMNRSSHDSTYQIDYEVVEKSVTGFPSKPPTETERRKFHFSTDIYNDAVVKPWYRDESGVFFVENVTVLKLNTPFDENTSLTFNSYYIKHYDLEAYNYDQTLLDGSRISKQLNCLFPPIINKKSKLNMQKQYFVPEFCFLHPMPASYWLMLLQIPSILYRINHLLLADQLRIKIIDEIGNYSAPQSINLDGLDSIVENASTENLETAENSERLNIDMDMEGNEMEEDDTIDFSDEDFLSDTECSNLPCKNSFLFETMMDEFGLDSSGPIKAVEFENPDAEINTLTVETEPSRIIPPEFYNNKDIEERISAPKLNNDFKLWLPQSRNSSHQIPNPSCGVQPVLLLQALTTKGACDSFNLERLETMGDSFLKLISTFYFYHQYSNLDEGKLTYLRSLQICNANLLKLGYEKGIPSFMTSCLFEPKDNWIPPSYKLKDEPMNDIVEDNDTLLPKEIKVGDDFDHYVKQRMCDKSIADCVEALIGAHFTHLGKDVAIEFMRWLGLKVDIVTSLKTPIQCLTDRFGFSEAERHVLSKYGDRSFSKIEETIGYYFHDRSFLIQAFIHISFHSPLGCYQRLEFLGDAVLDFLITRHLYYHNSKLSPGELTDLRSALVNNVNFASLVVKHDIHKYIISENEKLSKSIKNFELLCKTKGDLNFHDMMQLVDEDDAGEEEVEVPKALGDVFESLAGAIYLDSGEDIEVVWQIFYKLMKDVIEKWCKDPPKPPTRVLMEKYLDRIGPNRFEKQPKVNGQACVSIEIDGIVITGVGKSNRLARRSAAIAAVNYCKAINKPVSKS